MILPKLIYPSLVTLVGTGGTGKTRLSLQMAADLLETTARFINVTRSLPVPVAVSRL